MSSSKSPSAKLLPALRTILYLLALSTCVPARPSLVSRDAEQLAEQTPRAALASTLGAYFSIHGVKAPSFRALDGWKTIDWAGQNPAETAGSAANTIFHTLDGVQDLTGKGQENVLFSTQFTTFLQELAKSLDLDDPKKEDEVKAARDDVTKACSKKADVLDNLLDEYKKDKKDANTLTTGDEQFQIWAKQDARYTTEEFDCQDKTNAYQTILSKVYGDHFAVFSGSLNNVKPIIQPVDVAIPGITMMVSAGSGAPAGSSGSNGAGKTVPYYSIPSLNATLQAWQNGEQLQTFETPSEEQHSSDKENSESSGGGVSFSWGRFFGDVGAEGSEEHSSQVTNVSAQSIDIKFGSIALMDINSGMWNDKGAAAGAVLNAPDGDDAKKDDVQAIFKKYIGEEGKPGPAAVWNDKAVVVYQPSVDMQFSSEDSFNSFQKTSVSASGCFLFICANANHEQTEKMTTVDSQKHSIKFADGTKNAYIVGFIQTGFWVQPSNSSSGGNGSGGNNGGGDNGGY